jgi:hypothetical protein
MPKGRNFEVLARSASAPAPLLGARGNDGADLGDDLRWGRVEVVEQLVEIGAADGIDLEAARGRLGDARLISFVLRSARDAYDSAKKIVGKGGKQGIKDIKEEGQAS